jgi:hypothetical protein
MQLLKISEYNEAEKDVTIDVEKTFHCAASKKLVAHVGFTLLPIDPSTPSIVWKESYRTSLAYSRLKSFDEVKRRLLTIDFQSPGDNVIYRIDPKTFKEKRRRGE